MSLGRRILIVSLVLLASAAIAALVIWQVKSRGIPMPYVIGPFMVAFGIGLTVLNLCVGDESLRRRLDVPAQTFEALVLGRAQLNLQTGYGGHRLWYRLEKQGP